MGSFIAFMMGFIVNFSNGWKGRESGKGSGMVEDQLEISSDEE